jgi:hypothetical protein
MTGVPYRANSAFLHLAEEKICEPGVWPTAVNDGFEESPYRGPMKTGMVSHRLNVIPRRVLKRRVGKFYVGIRHFL